MAWLDVDTTVQNVKTMLSNLAAWQTICGVGSASEAAEKIITGGMAEDEEESLAPVIFLDVSDVPVEWLGNKYQGQLTVEIRCELAIPPANQKTFSDEWRYAWQKCSAILAGINGAVGGSGGLMARSLSMPTKPGKIDPNENQGRCEWGFILNMVIDFI